MLWKLKRTRQCKKCPWRTDVDPHDIPNGYCENKHVALDGTIADRDDPLSTLGLPLRIMACHETGEAHCIGWLMNQLGAGNNIALRLDMTDCENIDKIQLMGDQHETFDDTLPQKRL